MDILEIKNLSYSYTNSREEILSSVNQKFELGKFYAIIGKSGTGKSTLLSLLAGLDKPQTGQVLFKNENIDILIGTQMVVKGHHFPNVTLVGVIAADSSLNIDDYRANERSFQILTQVARTSRKRKTTRKSNNSKL